MGINTTSTRISRDFELSEFELQVSGYTAQFSQQLVSQLLKMWRSKLPKFAVEALLHCNFLSNLSRNAPPNEKNKKCAHAPLLKLP